MKYFLLSATLLTLVLTGCSPHSSSEKQEALKEHIDSLKSSLLQTDIAFSQYSEEHGRNAAFMEYADADAVLLRPYTMPLTGRDTIGIILKAFPDDAFTLTWMPIRADVSKSGDMGYTYGTYSLTLKKGGKDEGTYCSIWKKDKNHNWKFVLDTGNEGLKAPAKGDAKQDDKKREKHERPKREHRKRK